MKKVVIAMDSFKGSLSSIEAGEATKKGILEIMPELEIFVFPYADGGEGTLDAFSFVENSEIRVCEVCGPLGKKISAKYVFLRKTNTAIIESATAIGLTLVEESLRNPLYTTSYGLGELIKDALDYGAKEIIVTLGGSSTQDGGIGMLQALGVSFQDKKGLHIKPGAIGMQALVKMDIQNMDERVTTCKFIVACDVDNPLLGNTGTTYVYAKQKGAKEKDLPRMEEWMESYAKMCKSVLQRDASNQKGAGAAGGLGFAFLAFLNAEFSSGAKVVLERTNILNECKKADIVITGEGKFDQQSLYGKAPITLVQMVKENNPNCICAVLAGLAELDMDDAKLKGIDYVASVADRKTPLAISMQKEVAINNLRNAAVQFMNEIKNRQNENSGDLSKL